MLLELELVVQLVLLVALVVPAELEPVELQVLEASSCLSWASQGDDATAPFHGA